MNSVKVQLKHAFGIFVITASVFSSGCASNPQRQPMASVDLEYFQVDCKIRQQQIVLLQNMRTNRDDSLVANVGNILQPWQAFTRPDQYYQRSQIGSSRVNWLINQHLLTIQNQC